MTAPWWFYPAVIVGVLLILGAFAYAGRIKPMTQEEREAVGIQDDCEEDERESRLAREEMR